MSARHALTVLTRLAGRRPEETPKLERALTTRLESLGRIALDVAVETGDPMGRVLDRVLRLKPNVTLAAELVQHLPRESTALREAAVTITQLACDGAAGLQHYVLSLQLAERAGDAGDRARALEIAERARERILADPAMAHERGIVGRAHNVYGAALRDVGRIQDALLAVSTAVELRRELALTHASRADLATSLMELSSIYKEVGQRVEAADVGREAMELLDALAAEDPKFQPRLASATSNLATFLVDLDRVDEAVALQRDGLELWEVLSDRNPDAYYPYVGVAHNNLANNLSLLRRFDEALGHVQAAVQVFRRLAEDRPDVYGEWLAIGLNSLANRLNDMERTAEAVDAAAESVSAMRRFAARYQQAFTPVLARSLHTLAYRLYEANRLEQAAATADEAVLTRRALAAENERAFGVPLALSISVRAGIHAKAGEPGPAADAISEAMTLMAHMACDQRLGRAVARESKEIGGRYVRILAEAGRAVDQELVQAI